eukprot:COSAG06_NODE_52237_length_307_cov_0.519231_1_plen_21_part_10
MARDVLLDRLVMHVSLINDLC